MIGSNPIEEENVTDQATRAGDFTALHVPGDPLVLVNAWDAGSARAVTEAGARAMATGSWSVAAALGFDDGERTPLDLVMDNAARVVGATALPVTVDLEAGYGARPDDVATTVRRLVAVGAIGCNLEDSIPGTTRMRSAVEQAERLAGARDGGGAVPVHLNARTDVFLLAPPDTHDTGHVKEALDRAAAWADVADSLFVPGLVDPELITVVTRESPLPVNIMTTEGIPTRAQLADLGVARVSHGPGPYVAAMRHLTELARRSLR